MGAKGKAARAILRAALEPGYSPDETWRLIPFGSHSFAVSRLYSVLSAPKAPTMVTNSPKCDWNVPVTLVGTLLPSKGGLVIHLSGPTTRCVSGLATNGPNGATLCFR